MMFKNLLNINLEIGALVLQSIHFIRVEIKFMYS